jgi:putative membrane protein
VRWAWHLPVLFEAALRSEPIHALQHFTFFASAGLFWWSLILGRYGRMGYGIAVLFVFATALHTSVLGAMFALATGPAYPLYEERAIVWRVDALADQQLAGFIMWVAAGTLFVLLGLALFVAWLGEARRRAGKGEVARLARSVQ